jgi:transposase InsO family protein
MPTNSNSARYEAPLLSETGDDYNDWAWTMKLVLWNRGLLSIVDGTTPAPDATADPAGFTDWYQKDQQALLQIVMALKTAGRNAVNGVKSSKDCWDWLATLYQGEGDQRVIFLMEKLFVTPLTDTEPMQPQLSSFSLTAQQLGSAGLPVDDKLLAFLIVLRLPDSYSMLKTVLSALDSAKVSSKSVTSQILAEERRRVSKSAGGDVVAYYAKVKKGKRPDKSSTSGTSGTSSNGKKCSHCKRLGHEKSECRKLKKKKEEEEEKKKNATSTASKPSSSNTSSTQTTAKVAVAASSTTPKEDTIHLFRALALAHSPDSPECALEAQEELISKSLSDQWIIDSGASRNMCSHRSWFHHFTPLVPPINVVLGDDSSILATGVGRLSVRMHANGSSKPVVLQDVLFVPDLHGNLLSVSHFARRGAEMRFVDKGCLILDQRKDTVCEGDLRGNLYIMQMSTIVPDSARLAVLNSFPTEGAALPETALFSEVSSSRATIDTWHRRLGHLNIDAILRMMRKGMVKGMEITGSATSLSGTCEPCLKGKQTRMEVRKETDTRADSVLGRIFSDVCGKLPTRSHQGYLYFVTWIDDKSRKVFVAGLKEKSDVAQHLKAFVSRAELETGERLKVLRTDGGGEYIGGPVQKFLEEKGIRHEITTPDTPQHNGVAERMNRTLVERVRTMLLDADLPESYWWEALQYAALLHNVSPTRSLDDHTPGRSGNKPDVSRLRVFGCRAFVHIPDRLRDKFAAKSLICRPRLCPPAQGVPSRAPSLAALPRVPRCHIRRGGATLRAYSPRS